MRKTGQHCYRVAVVTAVIMGGLLHPADAQPPTSEVRKSVLPAGSKYANPRGPCLTFHGLRDAIIENVSIGPCGGNGIELHNSHNVTVRNVLIADTVLSGIYAVQSTGVEITESRISNGVTGINVVRSSSVRVSCNTIEDPRGPIPRGQLVQFNNVTGADNRISCNAGRNQSGAGRRPEDAISLFQSSGNASSPIMISHNVVVGGGPSISGGGIMLGDAGGAYQIAQDNILVDPGQYGIAVSSGNNMSIRGNSILARRQPFTNVGIYAWNQYKAACYAISIEGNKVKWTNKTGEHSPFWDGENCGRISGIEKNNFSADLSPEIAASKAPPECQCVAQGRR